MLTERGARVIALDRKPPPLAFSRYMQVDLGDPDSIDAAVASLEDEPVHGLCNIAGVPETAGNDVIYKVNYLGLKRLSGRLLPRMARGGAIVNLASTAGHMWPERANLLWELASIDGWSEAARASTEAPPEAPDMTAHSADVPENALATRAPARLTILVEESFPPFVHAEDGRAAGLAIDALDAAARLSGVTLEYTPAPASSVQAIIAAGRLSPCRQCGAARNVRFQRACTDDRRRSFRLRPIPFAVRS